MHRLVPFEHGRVELARRTPRAALSTARRRSASATTKLRFSSDAPCEIMRMLMPSSELKTRARHARSVADILAHQADDRLVVLDRDFGELPQLARRIASRFAVLSMVSETLTSDVDTMSTGVS